MLSEWPVISHLVDKICANDSTNNEIAEKCHPMHEPFSMTLLKGKYSKLVLDKLSKHLQVWIALTKQYFAIYYEL